MPRSTKPQISFADWELLQQGIVLEPLLQNISDFLDDHEETDRNPYDAICNAVLKKPPGLVRGGLTPQQVSALAHRHAGQKLGLPGTAANTDRRRLPTPAPVHGFLLPARCPNHDAFNPRPLNRLTPERRCRPSMNWWYKRAVDLGSGRWGGHFVFDSTVVQTDVHHPTDSNVVYGMSYA